MKSDLPKVLHPVAGRPMICEVVATAREVAHRAIVVVIGHGAEDVRAVAGPDLSYAVQREQLGTGHAVLQAENALSGHHRGPVLVLYGDSPLVTASTLSRALDTHERSGATITLLTFEAVDPTGYGRVVRGEDGGVVAIIEERDASESQKAIRECNSGFMVFDSEWLWESLPNLTRSSKGEYYLTDLTAVAVRGGREVGAIRIDPREVLGVNDRTQLAAASTVLWERRREKWMRAGVTMEAPETVWIEPDVLIGTDTTLEPNIYLRGKSTIGTKCIIGAFSILNNATVEDGVTLSPFTCLSD
jgi:bifunctional UDP-N-acetylglucosamine pyrophosphorylase/glucosamine-1-phosphate N-acetyltransferase